MVNAMRENFNRQLDTLNREMTDMGSLCESAIESAVRALLRRDEKAAESVAAIEDEINHAERDIEALCLKLLLKQQPVAADLRTVSSALKMITDLERIGDQAADIAEIVRHADFDENYDNEHIREMATGVSKMVTGSVDAFVERDLDAAKDVIRRDDQIDDLFKKACDDLAGYIGKNPKKAAPALDLMMTAKYLERIGDHAVNVAEWVEFSITGERR